MGFLVDIAYYQCFRATKSLKRAKPSGVALRFAVFIVRNGHFYK